MSRRPCKGITSTSLMRRYSRPKSWLEPKTDLEARRSALQAGLAKIRAVPSFPREIRQNSVSARDWLKKHPDSPSALMSALADMERDLKVLDRLVARRTWNPDYIRLVLKLTW